MKTEEALAILANHTEELKDLGAITGTTHKHHLSVSGFGSVLLI
ncbi:MULTISPECIES: hypothetical protein [Planktothrix]|jgi:hypothetical protein|uniref:Uncharacterized protein n=1 Tax=Planktothrix rubescens CCAP 1459/22 TaxID=329571 RepID=A0A6J7ZHD4_PLARU|nr:MULTISPECIES: hypothetical protein [Planktothrix]CAC5340926.1 hypothetical protein PLAN_120148 [Planktothrix rubescens NIVA-CYA 18]